MLKMSVRHNLKITFIFSREQRSRGNIHANVGPGFGARQKHHGPFRYHETTSEWSLTLLITVLPGFYIFKHPRHFPSKLNNFSPFLCPTHSTIFFFYSLSSNLEVYFLPFKKDNSDIMAVLTRWPLPRLSVPKGGYPS